MIRNCLFVALIVLCGGGLALQEAKAIITPRVDVPYSLHDTSSAQSANTTTPAPVCAQEKTPQSEARASIDLAMAKEKLDEQQLFLSNERVYSELAQGTLRRQAVYDALIFALVIVITGVGLYLSYLQFSLSEKMALEHSDRSARSKTSKDSALKIALTGVEIRSSVIGLSILIISLAFFYLTLQHVYDIHTINPTGGTAPQDQVKTK